MDTAKKMKSHNQPFIEYDIDKFLLKMGLNSIEHLQT